jgi:hypothetical protein
MIGAWRDMSAGRQWAIAFAALALLVQVLVPQGFMLSGEPSAPGLAICTGHGPLLGVADHHKPGKAPKTASNDCVFAIHGAAAGPPAPIALTAAPFAYIAAANLSRPTVAPSLGLAAPPPPTQAPPTPLV